MKGAGAIKKLYFRVVKDSAFRFYVGFLFSTLSTAVFTGYNLLLAVIYRSAWNVSIGVYYAVLTFLRADVLLREGKSLKQRLSEEKKRERREKFLPQQCRLLFVADIALIAPIALMVLEKKQVVYSAIAAISVAAYTVYKVVLLMRGFFGTKKKNSLKTSFFHNINLIDTSVSVLTLQYTLIMTFGEGIKGTMFTLCAFSSFVIWTVIVFFSVRMQIAVIRTEKNSGRQS